MRQNLPVYPFLTPTRKADVIFAVDSSAGDTAPPPFSAVRAKSYYVDLCYPS